MPVKVYARGGADTAIDGARVLAARQTTGLPLARKVLYEGLKSRASAVVMDYLGHDRRHSATSWTACGCPRNRWSARRPTRRWTRSRSFAA